MQDSGLEKNEQGQTRTLYSLRHTYATLEMLRGEVDIHTLSKQMGNSAAMIEQHYSKLTATMAAERLAWWKCGEGVMIYWDKSDSFWEKWLPQRSQMVYSDLERILVQWCRFSRQFRFVVMMENTRAKPITN